MTHIIRQQCLHVELNGTESDGIALNRRLPGLCEYWLIPAIEGVLDRFAPPNGHLYIKRLEIDAGTLSLERLEHDLTASVTEALAKLLHEQLPFGDLTPTNLSSNIQQQKSEQYINEAFIYFLETGNLPWSFRLPENSTLEQAILASWQETTNLGNSLHTVNADILRVLATATARERLLRQFSQGFLKTLLSLLLPEDMTVMDEVLQILRSSDELPEDIIHFERYLWETIFANIAEGKKLSVITFIDEACLTQPTGLTTLERVLKSHFPDSPKMLRATAHRKKTFDSRAPNRSDFKSLNDVQPELANILEPRSPNNVEPRPLGNDEPTPLKLPVTQKKFPTTRNEHAEAGTGIYIENAGLILLHPFLPQFFSVLGIAAEDQLLQPERALCLLHFLTTGQLIAPEYELVLPKIICNVPLETPLDADVALTITEQEEAVALLSAVIRHWEALRNTSPDGLRGTFLLRPGKVSLRDGDWLLQVEPKTFDILLDQLPWGISMIKLPWMEKMLWVEWR